ncbi:MAG: TMEM175 family protein [Ferruginibacter sp.]
MSEVKHPKHDFMIERIAFFSDAVFAIAITLMAIEIRPPHVSKGDTDAVVWGKFKEILPEFLGLLVSFWLIGGAWLRHHQLFKYVDNFDIRFMAINLWLLFTIILFPFSTSFLFNSIFAGAVTKLQVFFYLGVPLFSNLILYFMYKRVNKKHLKGTADISFRRAVFSQGAMIVAFMLAITWIAIMPIEYHPFGYIFLGVGPIIISIYKKRIKNK